MARTSRRSTRGKLRASQTVPAVVVGGTLNSLGVVRSLAPAGIPIYVLDISRQCAAAWSRHCQFVRTPSLEGPALIEALTALANRLGARPVLILTSDDSVTTVSQERQCLEGLYRLSLPARDMVAALADKSTFHALALREGFPVPRSVWLGEEAHLSRIRTLAPPLVVKPADKVLVLNGIVDRAVRAESTAEAEAAASRMLRRSPRLIVQEWVEGPDTEIFFTLFACDPQSRVIGLFPGRKVVCSPPAIGTTAVCVAAPEVADELTRETLNFIARTSYRGLGSLEFKRDARTGAFFIIEPTVGRTDWQEEIATLCGVNLPLLAYCNETGVQEPLATSRRSGLVAWRSSREIAIPQASRTQGLRVFDGYLRWSDPIPAIYHYGYERFTQRIWRRATSKRGR